MLLKAAACLSALLAAIVYRNGRVVRYHFLAAPELPDAYYAGGDWTAHCSFITDNAPAGSSDIDHCEDITFWDHLDADGALTDRLILLGCDPNRKAWNTVMGPLRDPNPRGHLFLYSPTTDTVHRLSLAGYPADQDFHPLGMDIYPSHSGSPSDLFVVNHARAHTTIEQFVLDPAAVPIEARYVRTLRSPYFISPNAIALTGPMSFFVSNDHLFTRRLLNPMGHVLPLLESLAALPLSWVSHVVVREPDGHGAGSTTAGDDGDAVELEHSFAALGIPFANGVAISPSRQQFAVAATSLGVVHFYSVNDTGSGSGGGGAPALSFSHSVPVPFLPDNIAYDDDSVLIVTGHPHFPSLVAVAANQTKATAPSWAVSLSPIQKDNKNMLSPKCDQRAHSSASKFAPAVTTDEVETLFQSNGSVFSSSSTTLRDARTGAIYIAGLYERGILACRPH